MLWNQDNSEGLWSKYSKKETLSRVYLIKTEISNFEMRKIFIFRSFSSKIGIFRGLKEMEKELSLTQSNHFYLENLETHK